MNTSTLTDNATTTGKLYEAFGRGDIPFILKHIDEHCIWIGAGGEYVPTGGTYVGKEAMNFFTRLDETVEFSAFKPVAIHNINDQEVIAFGNMSGKSKQTGKTYSSDWAMHWTFDEKGNVIKYQDFYNTAAAYVANLP